MTENEQVTVEGLVENIIFRNAENGYSVFSIDDKDNKKIVCVGTVADLRTGENIKVTGKFVVHPAYGKQLAISVYEKTQPNTCEGIEKYLASGVIKSIGQRMAKRIVDMFGMDTFDVIENTPEKLAKVRGITLERAFRINTIFHEQAELRNIMIFLQGYGISSVYALKIYKRYKERTFDVVKTNPYRLADDIFGIGFKMADTIAMSIGIENNSPYRVKAGIKYILNQAANNGHIYLPKNILLESTSELLEVDFSIIDNLLLELQLEHQVWIETFEDYDAIFLNVYYYAEQSVAKKLLELSLTIDNDIDNIDKAIKDFELQNDLELHDNQREAVKQAMQNGVLIITGGPGTGKTTTINTIINLLTNVGKEISLAAPTGRAAKRLTEATNMQALTIHRLLEISFLADDSRQQKFERNENNQLDTDVVIVDESSMIDILLANHLLKAIAPGTKLIIVGDADQLPSVGPGNFLKDSIKSNHLKVVHLTEIFRQAQESAIVMNAHRINNGEYPVFNEKNKDFFFMNRIKTESLIDTLTELILKRLPKYLNCNHITDIQVLTPMRKSPVGVNNLNIVLQNTLNPKSPQKSEKEFRSTLFREGDKVMQIKNNYDIVWKVLSESGKLIDEGVGVFNGDTGILTNVSESSESITVLFDDGKVVEYDFSQLEELELAYAITIHKSQGSEYPAVIIPIYQGPYILMTRNLLYTAVTRAKKLVVLVGIEETINRMVDNNREFQRYSSLSKRLIYLSEFIKT